MNPTPWQGTLPPAEINDGSGVTIGAAAVTHQEVNMAQHSVAAGGDGGGGKGHTGVNPNPRKTQRKTTNTDRFLP
jgi:hypothetical protein